MVDSAYGEALSEYLREMREEKEKSSDGFEDEASIEEHLNRDHVSAGI